MKALNSKEIILHSAGQDFQIMLDLVLLACSSTILSLLLPRFSFLEFKIVCNPNNYKTPQSKQFKLERQLPVKVFDTQIAAAYLGHGPMCGFKKLLESMYGYEMDKKVRPTFDILIVDCG